MEAYIEQLIGQSLVYVLLAVMLVSFLESLALVGLLLPGAVMMATLGALIGSGQLGFYQAWLAGIAGCFLGDWLSYFIGHRFKQPLRRWSFLKKHQDLLTKTEYALHQHSMITILLGRFIGPTRPLIPMVAGMLGLPVYKFALPNIIGCVTWPPVYFLPGTLAGVALYIPAGASGTLFKWLLLLTVLLCWCAIWLAWRWWRADKHREDWLSRRLSRRHMRWVCLLCWSCAIGSVLLLVNQPMMPIFRQLLWKVLAV